ncbi:hypothetical protein KDW98_28305 [Burkholderia vietnamiensis]|uniref:ribosome modulation factor n=1 Tax=Burkholderia vietnamiensis TaxID=60552 RepID=UPI000ACD4685|nr:hypothetical protein [Burkholderia vietnamiensis]MBR8165049.1 hypothetical protein [Burkholderia vietnamiensis]
MSKKLATRFIALLMNLYRNPPARSRHEIQYERDSNTVAFAHGYDAFEASGKNPYARGTAERKLWRLGYSEAHADWARVW